MRTRTTTERNRIAAAGVNHHLKVEVEDADRNYQDISVWVISAEWGESIDSATGTATLALRRDSDGLSLSPKVAASTLNRDQFGAYAPLLDTGRQIKISTAVTAQGVAPVSGDWKLMFIGRVDAIDWGTPTVTLQARDLGGWVVDAWIQEEREYATAAATPIENVMADVLDDWPVFGTPTLYTPTSPAWLLHNTKHAKQARKSVLEALQQDYALSIGWVCRYRFDALDNFRLTFYDVNRARTTPDDAFAPDEYQDITSLEITDADVRNYIVGIYYDASGVPHKRVAENSASQGKYGVKFMEIALAPGDQIDSDTEMDRLLDSAASDLGDPFATQEMRTLYYWPVQLGDLYNFVANDDHYDSDQKLAVVSYMHHFENGEALTTMQCSGNIKGAFKSWFRLVPNKIPIVDIRITQSGATVTQADYDIVASSSDGSDVDVFLAAATDPYNATPDFTNSGSTSITRATNAGEDRTLRVRAISKSGGIAERIISVDFDTLPRIANVAAPSPLYDGATIVGWRVSGSVDDDTRALKVEVSGDVTLVASSLSYTLVSGAYWFDTTSTKTFTLDFAEPAGGTGIATLTPYEFYNTGAPGFAGAAYPQTLALAPVTSAVVRAISPTRRSVTLTVNPATAFIRYQLTGGLDLVEPGPSVTINNIDVSSGTVTLDYRGISASGVVEEKHRLTFDANDLPEITSCNLAEPAANVLAITCGFDEDLFIWRVWARKGSQPLLGDGVTPDNAYLVFHGMRDTPSFQMAAAGSGADPADRWYVVVRGYDFNGNYDEERRELVINGVPVPSISNARAIPSVESGTTYNDVLWDTNAALDAASPAWSVDISEHISNSAFSGSIGGTTGRNPTTDHDGGSASGVGGWHVARAKAPNGTSPFALWSTFDYTVELFDDTAVSRSTHVAQLVGWYYGPDATVRLAPSSAPPDPTPSSISTLFNSVEFSWTALTDGTGIIIEVESSSDSGATWTPYDMTSSLFTDPGTYPAQTFPEGWIRIRTQYQNYAGVGPHSNWVVVDLTP